MTQPTAGFGSTEPIPFSARSSANCIYCSSVILLFDHFHELVFVYYFDVEVVCFFEF